MEHGLQLGPCHCLSEPGVCSEAGAPNHQLPGEVHEHGCPLASSQAKQTQDCGCEAGSAQRWVRQAQPLVKALQLAWKVGGVGAGAWNQGISAEKVLSFP